MIRIRTQLHRPLLLLFPFPLPLLLLLLLWYPLKQPFLIRCLGPRRLRQRLGHVSSSLRQS